MKKRIKILFCVICSIIVAFSFAIIFGGKPFFAMGVVSGMFIVLSAHGILLLFDINPTKRSD